MHRLHLIESYGTGIRRIFSMYKQCSEQPKIEVTSNTFKIILPNMNSLSVKENERKILEISSQEQTIINYITEHGQISEAQIQDVLNIRKTRAYTIAKKMCDKGLIISVGRGSQKKYLLS